MWRLLPSLLPSFFPSLSLPRIKHKWEVMGTQKRPAPWFVGWLGAPCLSTHVQKCVCCCCCVRCEQHIHTVSLCLVCVWTKPFIRAPNQEHFSITTLFYSSSRQSQRAPFALPSPCCCCCCCFTCYIATILPVSLSLGPRVPDAQPCK